MAAALFVLLVQAPAGFACGAPAASGSGPGPGVTIVGGSPADKEYALPVPSSRSVGAGCSSGGGGGRAAAPRQPLLFGTGISASRARPASGSGALRHPRSRVGASRRAGSTRAYATATETALRHRRLHQLAKVGGSPPAPVLIAVGAVLLAGLLGVGLRLASRRS